MLLHIKSHFQDILAKWVKFQDNFTTLLKFQEFQESWDPCVYESFRYKKLEPNTAAFYSMQVSGTVQDSWACVTSMRLLLHASERQIYQNFRNFINGTNRNK